MQIDKLSRVDRQQATTGPDALQLTPEIAQALLAQALTQPAQGGPGAGALGGLLGEEATEQLMQMLAARLGGQGDVGALMEQLQAAPADGARLKADVEVPRAAQKAAGKMLAPMVKKGWDDLVPEAASLNGFHVFWASQADEARSKGFDTLQASLDMLPEGSFTHSFIARGIDQARDLETQSAGAMKQAAKERDLPTREGEMPDQPARTKLYQTLIIADELLGTERSSPEKRARHLVKTIAKNDEHSGSMRRAALDTVTDLLPPEHAAQKLLDRELHQPKLDLDGLLQRLDVVL